MKNIFCFVFMLIFVGLSRAENTDQKIDALSQEIEKLKSHTGVSLGGYGEMVYQNFSSSTKKDQIDFARAVLYVDYKFNEHFQFNSETEFEHGTTERGGAVSVEFATLDYLWKEFLNVRAGMILIPVGIYNEMHEPTTFFPTARPFTEQFLLPSTWSEDGIGIFGISHGLSYKAYLVNGLDS